MAVIKNSEEDYKKGAEQVLSCYMANAVGGTSFQISFSVPLLLC